MIKGWISEITEKLLANYIDWVIFPIIIILGHFIIKKVDKYVAQFFERVEYDQTLEVLVQKTTKVFLWIVVLMIALSNIGFNVSGFIAGLGVMGFIVGFAVKDVLSNLAAGIFLLVKRPFSVGEIIDVSGVKGKVEIMTLSSCIVITEEKHFVTIPNAKIWGNPIRNISRLSSDVI